MAIIFHCNGIFIFHSSVDGHLVCLHPLAFMNNCSVAKLCPTLCDSVDCRLSCLSLSPAVCPDSCPLSGWCCLTISSSAAPFSFCLQSFLASRPFPMSPLFASSGQSTGASASGAVLPMNIHGWFPLGLITLPRKCVHTCPEDTEGWLHPSLHTRDLSILILVSSGVLEQSPWGTDSLGGLCVFLWTYVFISPRYIPRSGIAGSHGNSMFNFSRNYQTVFQNGMTLHSHHRCVRAPITVCPCQHLLVSLHFCMHFRNLQKLEKEMATHSSVLAWKSPWTEEPGGLQSMGLHDWACVRWVGSCKLVELKKKKK